ncbi:MAG: hypothetical protein LBQ54_08480 [Planctomycetaceae bacterium]|nr:hypothetical protein [Planctomycetaceae bacterium]
MYGKSLRFFVFSLVCVNLLISQSLQAQLLRRSEKSSDKVAGNNIDLKTIVPWNELKPDSAQIAQNLIETRTIFRSMPLQTNYCDKQLYLFLLDHPDVIVGMWEQMGVTQLSLREKSPGKFFLKETTGSAVDVEFLYKSANIMVVYSKGSFIAPMTPKPISGESLLILHSRFGTDGKGRPAVQCRLDCYAKIHNSGAEMLAKLLVPVLGKVADSNFEQVLEFVSSVSDVAESDYESVQEIALRLNKVKPSVANEFAVIAEEVYDRAAERYLVASRTLPSVKNPPAKSAEKSSELFNNLSGISTEKIAEKEEPVDDPVEEIAERGESEETNVSSEERSSISVAVRYKLPPPNSTYVETIETETNERTSPQTDIFHLAGTPQISDPYEVKRGENGSVIIPAISVNTLEFVNSASDAKLRRAVSLPLRPVSIPEPQVEENPPVSAKPFENTRKPEKPSEKFSAKPSPELPPKPNRLPVPVLP